MLGYVEVFWGYVVECLGKFGMFGYVKLCLGKLNFFGVYWCMCGYLWVSLGVYCGYLRYLGVSWGMLWYTCMLGHIGVLWGYIKVIVVCISIYRCISQRVPCSQIMSIQQTPKQFDNQFLADVNRL